MTGRSTLALVAASTLALSSCTSLPSYTEPQALRSFVRSTPTEEAIAPVAGQEPDLLLRDFFAASGKPIQNHQAARAFLTPDAARRWDDAASTLILDRIDLNAKPGATPNAISYVVRGTVVGALGPGGVFSPDHGDFEAEIQLSKVDGEWRINSLPAGTVFERVELRNNYSPEELFFFDPNQKMLVRDRRWIYKGQKSMDTSLLSLLVEGPKGPIAAGVTTEVPVGATFAGNDNGVYRFNGFADLSAEERHRFAAQVLWTLAKSGTQGPYNIELDGTPLDPQAPVLTIDDVAEYNPNATSGSVSPLYAVGNGSLTLVDSSTLTPVAGTLGSSGRVESADISGDYVAGVIVDGEGAGRQSTLVAGPVNGSVESVLQARTLTQPSLESHATALWTVLDGRTIARVARSTSTNELSQSEVDATKIEGLLEPDGEGGEGSSISMLKLSPTGVRAAMVIGGKVYLAVISRPAAGEKMIANIIDIAPSLDNTVVSVAWQLDGSLVVGTANQDAPIWRVETDGSAVTQLPSGNITAPVVAVAASANTLYVTDARSVLQLPINSPTTAFWREVPALQGVRAVPVVGS